MSVEVTDTKWLAVSSTEYAVLQRIAGAAECVVALAPHTSESYDRAVSALAVILADYTRDEAS